MSVLPDAWLRDLERRRAALTQSSGWQLEPPWTAAVSDEPLSAAGDDRTFAPFRRASSSVMIGAMSPEALANPIASTQKFEPAHAITPTSCPRPRQATWRQAPFFSTGDRWGALAVGAGQASSPSIPTDRSSRPTPFGMPRRWAGCRMRAGHGTRASPAALPLVGGLPKTFSGRTATTARTSSAAAAGALVSRVSGSRRAHARSRRPFLLARLTSPKARLSAAVLGALHLHGHCATVLIGDCLPLLIGPGDEARPAGQSCQAARHWPWPPAGGRAT